MVGVAWGVLSACEGPQSALAPAGRDAAQVLDLFGWMAAGAIAVWMLVVGLAIYAIRVQPGRHDERRSRLLIIGGGVLLPTLALAVLLAYALSLLPRLLAPAPASALSIAVTGEQWWWRVRYVGPDGAPVELANEIRLPVGRRVQLYLDSPDVIHAFWIPAIAGKVDMIPGRVNRLALEPTRTGVFRGACAEFCGASHAFMNFYVVVMEEDAFEGWLAHQSRPAGRDPTTAGLESFLGNGCGACHTVRGTPADGVIGPDLTHVGSRLSLGAGRLANDRDDFRRWIARTDHFKPGARMPAFGMLPEAQLDALAAYLDGLE